MSEQTLTTAQLSAATGLRAGTLRMWEARYGFPVPRRLPGGGHRYTAADVELVRGVLTRRAAGLSLRAAIERAQQDAQAPRRSIFRALRSRRPDLQLQTVSKRALLALTRAIEDEHLAGASGGVAIASFQTEQNYRASRCRWRELAATADVAVALADFSELRADPGVPVEVPLDGAPEMHREWTLIVSGREGSACLAAWEIPVERRDADAGRMFETIWSFEPASVRDALRSARDVIAGPAPETATRLAAAIADPVGTHGADLRFASDLAGRAFRYLAAEVGPAKASAA